MKQQLLKTIYNFGGFAPFHNLNSRKVLILMYHRFSEESHPYKISKDEFEAHLEYLAKHNNILSLDEVVEAKRNNTGLPPNPTVITIDDGYSDAYDIAFPLLQKYRMPATLYVITDFLDDKIWLWTDLMRYLLLPSEAGFFSYEHPNGETVEAELEDDLQKLEVAGKVNSILKKLSDKEKDFRIKEIAESLEVEIPEKPTKDFAPITWKQAREMDKSVMDIESHTVTHPILPNINAEHLEFELVQAKDRLEKILERKVKHFCYPNGSLNENVEKATIKAGYKSAVTTKYGFNNGRTNLFLLKRIDASPNIANFAQSVSGFEQLRQRMNI
ncbi:MAG: polysaccharide deacetylase family protein [Aridibacter sp.]